MSDSNKRNRLIVKKSDLFAHYIAAVKFRVLLFMIHDKYNNFIENLLFKTMVQINSATTIKQLDKLCKQNEEII